MKANKPVRNLCLARAAGRPANNRPVTRNLRPVVRSADAAGFRRAGARLLGLLAPSMTMTLITD